MKIKQEQVKEFLNESNKIERVTEEYALDDALKAWEYIIKKDTLTVKDVLKVHKLLMNRLNPRIAGQFRKCDVYIGRDKKPFISTKLLELAIGAIVNMMNNDCKKLKTKREMRQRIKDHHVMFEGIHPFEDGNGRTGRILYNWERIKNGIPIHIIYTGDDQYQYYEWFRGYDQVYRQTKEREEN